MIRLYGLHLPDKTFVGIKFCPWCGEKLPKELDDEWGTILEKEYGIKMPGLNKDKVPQEFLTEDWWKKRGL